MVEELSPSRLLEGAKNLKDESFTSQNTLSGRRKGKQEESPSARRAADETINLNGQQIKFKRMFNHPVHKKDENIVNGAILSLEHCFGYNNTPIYKTAQFISEDTILYPSGRHLATLDLVSRRMDFIRRDEPNVDSVTALAVGFSRKKELVVGVGEKLVSGLPRVSIYIPSRLRWFYLEHDAEVVPNLSAESTVEYVHIPNYKKLVVTVTRPAPKANLIVAYFRYEK